MFFLFFLQDTLTRLYNTPNSLRKVYNFILKKQVFYKIFGGGKSLIIYNFTSCIIKATVLCTSLYLRQAQKNFGFFSITPNSYLIRTNFVSDSY